MIVFSILGVIGINEEKVNHHTRALMTGRFAIPDYDARATSRMAVNQRKLRSAFHFITLGPASNHYYMDENYFDLTKEKYVVESMNSAANRQMDYGAPSSSWDFIAL